MFEKFLSKESLRKRALADSKHAVMQQFLSKTFPDKKQDWREVEIVALDLETTGLDPEKDNILSFGLIQLHHGSIQCSTARHQVVNTEQQIPESSAVIHQITDDASAAGKTLEAALPELLTLLAGKVMLVHFARIEQQFINAACQRLYGSPFIIPTIDTLLIAQRLLRQRNHNIQTGELRLFNLRRIYGLPEYKAHNALYDALATAELFLALTAEIAPRGAYKLGEFLT